MIQDPSEQKWLVLELPIKGITTTIGSEFEGVYQGLKYVQEHFKNQDSRVVILSDCKFVVNSILNKCNSETYNFWWLIVNQL